MSNAQIYELHRSEAISHLLSVIDADGKNLSLRVSENISGGRFYVFAPPGVRYDRLKKFESGGLVPSSPGYQVNKYSMEAVENLADDAAKLVCELAKDLQLATAFVREPYLNSGDNSQILPSLVPIDSQLYKVIALEFCEETALTKEIKRFQVSWSFLLILSEVGSDEREMRAILAKAVAIFVNAYDGESYLCWVRSSENFSDNIAAERPA